jgi:hypothetical protein
VDECCLYDFGLLSSGGSSDGLVWAIAVVTGIIVVVVVVVVAAGVRIVRIRRAIGRIGVGVCAVGIGGRSGASGRSYVHWVAGRLI